MCSDSRLRELVDAATQVGPGIGGATLLLKGDGTPVFVKQVRLTDLERQPENVGSTANLFDLPFFCHYGVGTIGGPGFGAWRELAAHTMTTSWVLAGEHEGFPLIYHGRVHFDAHFQIILTDGSRLFFADYGLAISSQFELTPGETAFFAEHEGYDRYYTAAYLVNWLAVELYGYGPEERRAFVRACAEGVSPEGVPAAVAAALLRDAPVAAVMGDFCREFQRESGSTRWRRSAGSSSRMACLTDPPDRLIDPERVDRRCQSGHVIHPPATPA